MNLCSPTSNESYQERLLRLEGDKESLVLQVWTLLSANHEDTENSGLKNPSERAPALRPSTFNEMLLLIFKRIKSSLVGKVQLDELKPCQRRTL